MSLGPDVIVRCRMRGLRTTLDDMFTDMAFATTEAGQRHRALLADAENFRLARLARRSTGSPASGTRLRTSDRRRHR